MTISEQLADFILHTPFLALPPSTVDATKTLILDHLGVSAIGATMPWSRIAEDIGRSVQSIGDSSVYFSDGPRVAPTVAAFINGTFGHAFEFDDHCLGAHPGCLVIPAALAVAEAIGGVSGPDLIAAVALGYEVLIRLADAMGSISRWGHHPTGSMGAFGAAAAAGRVLGLGHARLVSALGLAGNFPTGVCEFHHGTEEKRVFAARAAESGVLACQLSQRGLTGPRTIFEGEFGFCHSFSRDVHLDRLTAGMGDHFRIEDTRVKLYPCAGKVAPFIEAAFRIRAEHPAIAAGVPIRAIRIEGHERMLDKRRIELDIHNVMGAQYSIPYGTVTALAYGKATPTEFSEDVLRGTAVQTLLRRTIVESFADYDGIGRIEIDLDGGDRAAADVYETRKSVADIDRAHLDDKFRGIMVPLFGDRSADDLTGAVERLDTMDDVSDLVRQLPIRWDA